ncbi:hypothetical protein A7A08_02658 [Methyloligella halotolerans]|uniref:Uncharacterized protein n=1 Tax=Methyloligella halotolerans TaxID=1177755 RepID=A0A1E2RWM5_9HYPH|nr:hypothetical protein [Methyloligella halotolerans]ODA66535.1 hypothetical protein A7A08_02658 [Methyloligella halotolerans]
MQTSAIDTKQLEAALTAVQRALAADVPPTTLSLKCLDVVIDHLREDGISETALQPLIDLKGLVDGKGTSSQKNRRKNYPPSDALLARVSAIIDLLVKAGYDESEAAQTLMRRLLAVGVQPPPQGGDARGWRRLLEWRSHLQHGLASIEAKTEYKDFTKELEEIPAGDRIKVVLDSNPWDRRQKKSG